MKITRFLSHQSLTLLCFVSSIMMTTHNIASCSPIRRLCISHASAYINRSCETTLYPNLCSKTLSKHADKINSSPKILAMTALAATFNATQLTSRILRNLTRSRALKPGEGAALLECVEEVNDAAYELQKSMKELKESRKGPEFYQLMDDVQTWVSAALTDDDTCMDDFTTVGRVKIFVRGFVLTIARLTSISLTFINSYAAV